MKRIKFLLNNRIDFVLEEGDNCSSLIQDVTADSLLVTIPAVGSQWRLLNVGDVVECLYYCNDGNVFMFDTRILERVIDNIPLFRISYPTSYKKVQRRDFVRVPVYLSVIYAKEQEHIKDINRLLRERTPDFIEDLYKGFWQRGSTLDISGGGMKLATKNPLEPKTKLIFIIRDGELELAVRGKVVRCKKHVGIRVSYHSGIEFIDITEPMQDRIISYIFVKLREMSKREF